MHDSYEGRFASVDWERAHRLIEDGQPESQASRCAYCTESDGLVRKAAVNSVTGIVEFVSFCRVHAPEQLLAA